MPYFFDENTFKDITRILNCFVLIIINSFGGKMFYLSVKIIRPGSTYQGTFFKSPYP